jgi:hypothetical protein
MPCQAQCTVYVESSFAPCSLFTSNQPLHLVHCLRRINPCTLFTVYVESTLAHCSLFRWTQPLHLVHCLRRIDPCTLFTVYVESTLAPCLLFTSNQPLHPCFLPDIFLRTPLLSTGLPGHSFGIIDFVPIIVL